MGPSLVTRYLTAYADIPQASWSNSLQAPAISNGDSLSFIEYGELLSAHQSVLGDLSCQERTLPMGPPGSGTFDGCWYDTSLGLVDKSGYFIKPMNSKYVGLFDLAQNQLIVTPNPDVFIQLVPTEAGGYYIDFWAGSDLSTTEQTTSWEYPLSYKLPGSAAARLTKADGTPWVVDDDLIYSQVNYSNNGQWMVIWNQNGSVARVNLNTFETDESFVHPVEEGDDSYATVSISNSGRYVGVVAYDDPSAAANGNMARVLDFEKCGTFTNIYETDIPFCPTRFIDPYVQQFIADPDYSYVPGFLLFYSDELLRYYVSNPSGGYDEFLVRAPGSNPTNYIALGDSYASGEGEGNSNFYPETDIHDINMCHLAKNSYPFLIGKDLDLDSTHSVACSGARILNVLDKPQYPSVPQNNTLADWLPGSKEQISRVQNTKPNVVTISMSGNDIGFGDIIKRCLKPGTCYKSYEDRLELVNIINRQFNRLVDMYAELKNATVPDAKIYVVAYPSMVKKYGDCGWRAPFDFDGEETVLANQLVNYLDSVIKLAAKKAGVFYVDTKDAFYGNRLCEGRDQSRAVNGLTVGKDIGIAGLPINILSNGSFHPTVYGHELLAARISHTTQQFTVRMPKPNNSIANPVVDKNLDILQAEKTNRPTYEVVYLDIVKNDYVYLNSEVNISYQSTLDDSSTRLNPFAPATIELHSTPMLLGKTQTDSEGNISARVKIPSSIKPGIHSINIYAKGVDGEMHNITQTIYVATKPKSHNQASETVGKIKTSNRVNNINEISSENKFITTQILGSGKVAKNNKTPKKEVDEQKFKYQNNVREASPNHNTNSKQAAYVVAVLLFITCLVVAIAHQLRYPKNN